ncbi:MAG: hypothetical protein J5796_03210, partial [Erysipelotrichaceae bacterium]|nr:hypothetical protein [Erysipelotrichaceae bacterium]
ESAQSLDGRISSRLQHQLAEDVVEIIDRQIGIRIILVQRFYRIFLQLLRYLPGIAPQTYPFAVVELIGEIIPVLLLDGDDVVVIIVIGDIVSQIIAV